MKHDDPELIIDRIIDKVGKDLVVGTPLAAGKPNQRTFRIYFFSSASGTFRTLNIFRSAIESDPI